MKITELLPKVINKTDFHLSKTKALPQAFGCYVICNFFNDILYIGQTINMKHRVIQHLDNPRKTKMTELGKPVYIYYNIVARESDLSKLERGWLNHFELIEGKLPLLNSVHSPIT